MSRRVSGCSTGRRVGRRKEADGPPGEQIRLGISTRKPVRTLREWRLDRRCYALRPGISAEKSSGGQRLACSYLLRNNSGETSGKERGGGP